MHYRSYGAEQSETVRQTQAREALESRLLEAVQQMHTAIADAKNKVYSTSSVQALTGAALLLGGVVLGPLLGMTAAAITAWVYSDRPSTEEVKQSIVNALNSLDRGVVGRLHGDIPKVLAGEVTFDKWMAAYHEVIKGVASQLDELKQTTLATHIRQSKDELYRAALAAWEEFKKASQDVAKFVLSPLLLGVGLVAGWYLISWLPKKRTA